MDIHISEDIYLKPYYLEHPFIWFKGVLNI